MELYISAYGLPSEINFMQISTVYHFVQQNMSKLITKTEYHNTRYCLVSHYSYSTANNADPATIAITIHLQ